jgi:hypothetical protein
MCHCKERSKLPVAERLRFALCGLLTQEKPYLASSQRIRSKEIDMIAELDRIILTEDLPEHGLKASGIGTVVLVHSAGKGYEVEFVALDGETLAVTTVLASQVRPTMRKEIPLPHGRGSDRQTTISLVLLTYESLTALLPHLPHGGWSGASSAGCSITWA